MIVNENTKNIVCKETKNIKDMTIIGNIESEAGKFAGRTATRAITTGLLSVAYSNFILGNPINMATIYNAGLMSGAAVLGETASRTVLPAMHITSGKSASGIAIEAAIGSAAYAYAYPMVFPGSNVPFATLMQTAAVLDASSMFVSDKVHGMLFEGESY